MSYICLLINDNGAVASADSRISIHFPFDFLLPAKNLHIDRGTKVFRSAEGKTVWACAGITRRGWISFPNEVKKIMLDDSLPLEERLGSVKEKICRLTRHNRLYTILQKYCPFLFQSSKSKNDFFFTMIWGSFDKNGKPAAGTITIKNGILLSADHYAAPVIIENGMNMNSLAPARNYCPHSDTSAAGLYHLAERRVKESIEKDMEIARQDPSYRATIGGKIRTVTILPY